ncbi:hypothetical protein [Mycobacterium shimoidei]|nr:hypothetical protein [Mycobacterium shimoidei]
MTEETSAEPSVVAEAVAYNAEYPRERVLRRPDRVVPRRWKLT